MASAILARRNEPHWPESNAYMGNPHPNSRSKPPNPNPNFALAGAASPDRADEPTVSSGAAVSDDSSKAAGAHRDSGYGYIAFNIASYTKTELRELKRRLVSELEQVRSVVGRIESREIQSSLGHSVSGMYGGGGGREVTSFHSGEGFVERPAKKKATAFGGCRPVAAPVGPTKRFAAAPQSESERVLADMMIKCRQILTKLLKQKGSNWFKTPVDVEGMNLFDYYQTIKHPMDLGTVRTNLSKGVYATPLEFADDIRLTFNNALIYNPKGHVVHEVAGRMLRYFDGEFGSAYAWYENQQAAIVREQQASIAREDVVRRRSGSWSRSPMIDRSHTPMIIHRPHAPVIERSHPPLFETTSRADPVHEMSPPRPAAVPQPELMSVSDHVLAEHQHLRQEQDEQQQQQQQQHMNVSKPVMSRMPKPKAKDVSKRPMSDEEKGKLGEALQNLPQEKMEQVLQIVKERHGALNQDGDEVELDFEALDAETLWELDRFVSSFKKSMSKFRRQEAMATGTVSAALQPLSVPAEDGNQSPMAEAKRIKKSEPADDDVVDIGDDLPTRNYPSIEIEKDNAAGGYASSSGSESSSTGSSGSDSDSSSGSDSDDDEGRYLTTGPRSSQ